MAVSTIESGSGNGATAHVDLPGGLHTTPGPLSVQTVWPSITNPGAVVVQALPGRRQIQIQNLDAANPLHIRLGTGAATVNDVLVAPGAIYKFPAGVSYEGEINGLGPVAAVQVVAVEFYA